MTLRTLSIIILVALFTLLPFHTFLVTGLDSVFFAGTPGIAPLLAAWKEILLVLFGLIFLVLVFLKKIPRPQIDGLDVMILLYITWALLTGVMRWGDDWLRIFWGAKYSLSFLVFFLLLRHFPFGHSEKRKIFAIILGSAAVVLFFGMVQKFLPPDFLLNFGYSSEFSTFDPQGATAYCQKISFTDTCRLQSFLSGPNQFSAYLLFVLPLFFFLIFHPFRKKKEQMKNAPSRAFGATFFLLGVFCLFFAYSRAAWGGLVISGTLGLWFLYRGKKWFRPVIWSVTGLGIVALVTVFFSIPRPYEQTCAPYGSFETVSEQQQDNLVTRFFCKVVYRGSSSRGHFERSRDGLKHILLHPFGTGLGDSGPASARFYDNKIGFIPESWYLQVGIDTGFPGLILFFSILFLLGKQLLKSEDWRGQALLCGLVGISVMAVKLHSWESASVALSFWGACGVLLAVEEKKGVWEKVKRWWQKVLLRRN